MIRSIMKFNNEHSDKNQLGKDHNSHSKRDALNEGNLFESATDAGRRFHRDAPEKEKLVLHKSIRGRGKIRRCLRIA